MTAAAWPVEAPKVAVTYLRISKDRDHDELGVARQRDSLREYIDRQGWVFGTEFCDNDLSASKKRHRPQYEALQRALRTGEADVLVVTETSRLTRHMRELEDLVDLINETGVRVHALRSGDYDLSTSGGRAMARQSGVWDRLEAERMSERIKSKMAEIARDGGWRGGPRPFGYDVLNGKLVMNKAEAKRIRGWVDDVIAGRTVSSIVTELNDTRVPTVRGGRWTGPTINQILLSPRIIGYTSSGGEKVAKADWPAIIDEARWHAVAGILAGRKRGPAPRVTLLAGLVWCGGSHHDGSPCGSRMWGAARGPDRPRLYACQKIRGGCGRISVSAAALDEFVVDRVLATAAGKNLSLVRAERFVSDTERLRREIQEDEQLRDQLLEDLTARPQRISRAEWVIAKANLGSRIQENEAALKALGAGDGLPAGLATIDADQWKALSFGEQRAVIAAFIDRITVNPIGHKAGKVFRSERLHIEWKA